MRHVAGVDEVGRGCLAGPVLAGAVILDPLRPVDGLRDSKLLEPSRREALAAAIEARAIAVAFGMSDVGEIDATNILRATEQAMRRAVEALLVTPDYLLVDALAIPGTSIPQRGIVHGDRLCASIAAASIVAKVRRDALMRTLHADWPAYRFDENKGYGTPRHLEALERHGASPLHRT
ncbi:MAG TPA: ribonuclease HII, partial [Candidatus Polarisedimenticolia bacterium]|nr:ribonuclease HII [Candidatus Polarisedimenticolia bacterium]